MATDDERDGGLSSEPFRWAIIPIILAFFGIGILFCLVHRRRARRRGDDPRFWPRGANHLVTSRRWGPWSGTRSQEGLNELGEAPPPYDPKRDDEEEGGVRPPEYPAAPPPAVTRGGREEV